MDCCLCFNFLSFDFLANQIPKKTAKKIAAPHIIEIIISVWSPIKIDEAGEVSGAASGAVFIAA